MTRITALSVLAAALFLTLVRTEWLCLPVAILAGLFTARAATRRASLLTLAGTAAALILITSLLAGAVPEVRNTIADRLTTMGDSTHDESLQARSLAIHGALDMAANIPFGKGLGFLDGPAYGRTPMANPSNASSADLGLIGMVFDLGYFGAAVYLVAIALLAVAVYRAPATATGTLVKATFVLALFHVWSNNPFMAPGALLLWTFAALACTSAPVLSPVSQPTLSEVHA